MELKDYTTEELRAELKRRNQIEKEHREKDFKKTLRCRNCSHCTPNPNWPKMFYCEVRTWGKTRKRNYAVNPSTKACEEFEIKWTEQ